MTKGVFIPIAITLDANYQEVRRLKFDAHTQTMWQPVHYIGGILTEPLEKYVVLYTDPKRFGKAADPVYVAVVNTSVERMDYIRKGYTRTTYTDREAGVWWEGDAIGELLLVVKDKSYIDKSK